LEELSDELLVERCQNELPYKQTAYRELLERYEPLVHNTCVRMLGNAMDADEVCQDAFLRVYHKIASFEGRSAFKTWLYKIVYNLCLEKRRSLARRNEKENTVADVISQDANDTGAIERQAAVTSQVHEAINKLGGEDRRLIILRYISGLSIADIAQVLDIGLSAAKMRLYRAQEKFKEVYTAKVSANPPQEIYQS
jgi:RNA polymerase sigma-70 factor (ECF subfamily)